MKRMTSAQARQSFFDFFAERGHAIVPSASLIPMDDPTLLFTNAGMNQFKDVFLGLGSRPYTRAADTQKCMRVSGKHNDLEEVGRDGSHHTFFEMLGNWSFGDYYKKEAIYWAWELLTKVYGLPKKRLWATVFKDELDELEPDDEAAAFWRSDTEISPDHVLCFGRKENFWEMADTGPCGPCSEIHFDRGPEACECRGDPDHACQVNGDCGRFVELWNLVFIQYNKDADGTLHSLPEKHVDTGMGFERLVALLQGVDSNYETDLFAPVIQRVQDMAGHTDEQVEENVVAYRVIADHGRAVAFLVGDGVRPGNEGRDYVLRMILRRAARFGRKLGLTEPFLAEVAEVVIETMAPCFPELANRREFILTTITQEEERFLRTLEMGLGRLDEVLTALEAEGEQVVSGDAAFRLYDTFGLPLEITRDVAGERGLGVDQPGYLAALEEQRERARQAGTFRFEDEETLRRYRQLLEDLQDRRVLGEEGVGYDPYAATELETAVAAILCDGKAVKSAREGDRVEVVLSATCFYVESGGQVSDAGFIAGPSSRRGEPAWRIEVEDVHSPVAGLVVHVGVVSRGRPRVGDEVRAVVDGERRLGIARNHTATHLLHASLRHVLGDHVQQAGSLVAPDRLRFDFSHPVPLTVDQLDQVSRSVNDAILSDYPVTVAREEYRQAVGAGVIALFGEKYGDVVRVLRIGQPGEPLSQELCGGTHMSDTGGIGLFQIVSEQGVGAGVRRIEAVTGRPAADLVQRQTGILRDTASHLGVSPDEVGQRVAVLQEELQSAHKECSHLQEQLARREFDALLQRVETVEGVSFLSARVDASSVEVLREMTDWFRDRLSSGVVALGTIVDERPALVVAATSDLVERGVDATKLVSGMARAIGGGGGGKPTLAQAGGRDAGQLDEALGRAKGLLREMLGAGAQQ